MSRYVTVASVSHNTRSLPEKDSSMDKIMGGAAHYAWQTRQFGADIVAYPEIYPHMHLGQTKDLPEIAEEVPGPTTERMMAEAKKLGMYIIWPLWEREGDALYNTAVLIDRQGEIVRLTDEGRWTHRRSQRIR